MSVLKLSCFHCILKLVLYLFTFDNPLFPLLKILKHFLFFVLLGKVQYNISILLTFTSEFESSIKFGFDVRYVTENSQLIDCDIVKVFINRCILLNDSVIIRVWKSNLKKLQNKILYFCFNEVLYLFRVA